MATLPFAIQLYTVRDPLAQDYRRTLERIKDVGYDYVELAGNLPLSPREIKTVLDDTGLAAIASHVGMADLKENVDAAIDAAKAVGYDYVVIPWIGGAAVPASRAEWLEAARFMNATGEKLHEAGLRLCYHNHHHEFEQIDGETIFDILMQHAQPEYLAAEVDTYWVTYAGHDPVQVIRRYTGRCPLLHIKDMTAGDNPTFAEVGTGTIDWQPIFEAGNAAGTNWYIVEQDLCPGDPLDSIRISADYMKHQRVEP